MSVSLFKSVLPSTVATNKEGKSFFDDMKLPKGGQPSHYHANYKKNLVLAKLILEVCGETADAIINNQYKKFDALIKNYGCQITALEVQQKLKRRDLHDEAILIKQVASRTLQQIEAHLKNPPVGERQMDVINYLSDRAKVDIEISSEMAQLVRFRILNIINTDILVNDREVPCTKIENVQLMVEKIDKNTKIPIKAWIESLQAEESIKAAKFIQQVSQKDASSRGIFVNRLLGDAFLRLSNVKKSTPIVSLPQLYNGEACLRGIDGIVLVKNKLKNAGIAIDGADPIKVFVQMPGERILTQDEVNKLQDHEPLFIMEGFVKKGVTLDECIGSIGLTTILNASLAKENQYASETSQDPINDATAIDDIEYFKNAKKAYEAIQFEHIYCGSFKEEK